MSKTLKKSDLAQRPAVRTLLAVSLCASIAAFGCTTDRTLGNGDPVVTPGLRTSPTGGATTGTETESVPPPMISSYSGAQALPAVRPRISREEAALLLTEMQPRVKVLGPVAPGSSSRANPSDRVAMNLRQVDTRSTINSSIHSAPTEGIISGAGEAVIGPTSSNVAVAPTVTNAGAAVIAAPSAATATPTGTSISAPSAFASVRTLSPTAAAVVNPPASISSSSTLATASSARNEGSSTVNAGTVNTQAVTTQAATSTTPSVANPVRVVTANGRTTVTNVSTSIRQQ